MACRTTKENLSFRTTTEATPIDGHTQETGAQMQTPSTRQTSSPPCVFSPTYRGIVYPIQPAKPPSPESQSALTRQDGEKKVQANEGNDATEQGISWKYLHHRQLQDCLRRDGSDDLRMCC